MPPIRNLRVPKGCRKDGYGIWTAIEACHDPIENARNRKKRLTKLGDRRSDPYGQWRVDNDHLDQGKEMNCICGKPNEKCVVLKNEVNCCIYIGKTCIRYFPGIRHATQTTQGYTRDGFVVDDDASEDDVSDASEDDATDLYMVDSITAHKKIDHVLHYRVHWVGYPTSQDTWEPPSSFRSHRLLRAYQKAHLIKY